MTNPIVFISYSHDNDLHRQRVLDLSERLRGDGYETRLDHYVNDSPPEGWPRWMLNQFDDASHVLVVCTETYYRRFRGKEAPGVGKGVDWEGAVITQELYDSKSLNRRFIPVVFHPGDTAHIPEPLRSATWHQPHPGKGYEDLREALDGAAGIEPSPVGAYQPRVRKTAGAFAPSSSVSSSVCAARPNPYDPRRPVVPPLFVGRQSELRQLGLALDRGESVSLVGDSRIGKSSLLKTWAIEARKRGREVREVNGKDGAGASIVAFVKAITGANAPNDPDGAAEVLNAWIGQQGPLAPLVLVDHARDVLRGFDARFWSRVRAMLDRSVWVFATAAEISEFKPDSPLMNRLKLMRLGLLEPAAAEALVEMAGFAADDGALMHEWAGRHPFYLQLFGQCLGDCETSREALGRFTDEAEVRLQELWRAMEDRDRNTLKNLLTSPEWKKSKLANRGLLNDRLEPFGQVVARWLKNLE